MSVKGLLAACSLLGTILVALNTRPGKLCVGIERCGTGVWKDGMWVGVGSALPWLLLALQTAEPLAAVCGWAGTHCPAKSKLNSKAWPSQRPSVSYIQPTSQPGRAFQGNSPARLNGSHFMCQRWEILSPFYSGLRDEVGERSPRVLPGWLPTTSVQAVPPRPLQPRGHIGARCRQRRGLVLLCGQCEQVEWVKSPCRE